MANFQYFNSTNHSSTVLTDLANNNRSVPCKTKENKLVKVKLNCMMQCGTFRQMFVDLNMEEMSENDPNYIFPVNIDSKQLEKVIDWCENHIGVADPVITENELTRERNWFTLTPYEQSFFDVPVEQLADLLMTANYLDLMTMYLFGCQTMAALLKDSSPEKIREMLGLEDDLTEEEKDEIRKQNVWCNY